MDLDLRQMASIAKAKIRTPIMPTTIPTILPVLKREVEVDCDEEASKVGLEAAVVEEAVEAEFVLADDCEVWPAVSAEVVTEALDEDVDSAVTLCIVDVDDALDVVFDFSSAVEVEEEDSDVVTCTGSPRHTHAPSPSLFSVHFPFLQLYHASVLDCSNCLIV